MAEYIATLALDIPAVPNLADVKFVVVNRFAVPGALRRSGP
jgi:hypothetical protein